MSFVLAGLPAGTLLAVFGAAGAAIVALYFLKLRRRPVPVPFARLWARVLREQDQTTLFSQLQRWLSLLLQLALLALLVVALGDPRRAESARAGRHLVVLVDASASMQATDVATPLAPGRTRLDVAREKVRELVRGLSGSDRMLVAQMDARVTPLGTMTGEASDLEASLATLRATDAPLDFARALRFAADTLRGASSPEIVVVSDGALPDAQGAEEAVRAAGAKLDLVAVGERSRNVGITAFSVRRYPFDRDRYEVMLELTSASTEPEEVELELVGDGVTVDLTKLRVAPGEKVPRFWPNLTGARRTLEARLRLAGGGHDDLAADDHAYALLPEPRRVRVLAVTSGNTYLEAALLLGSWIEADLLDPAKYPPPPGKSWDVTIFDGVTPAVAPGAGSLVYLNPSGPASPVKVGAEVLTDVGFDKLDRKSPLLRWTAMDDVFVGKARRLEPRPGDRVVGASEKGALLVDGRRDGTRFVALGFDPRESDLVLRMAWPLFVLDLLGELVVDDATYLATLRTGEPWRMPVPAGAAHARLRGPGGLDADLPVEDGRAAFLGTAAGFYTLEAAGQSAPVAANLVDPAETAIAPRKELAVGAQQAAAPEGFHAGVRDEPWIWLLAAAVLVATIEWMTWHRRVTV